MENFDLHKKSILKKSDLTLKKKEKKVTFCSTVKLFIDDNNLDKKTKIIDLQSNCIEVSIVDKSSGNSTISIDDPKHDDCNATDFLVHKVIYDNPLEHDDDAETDTQSEEADENLIMFENNADDEALQFVVHKVTDHEDDLIQQELDFEDNDVNVDYSEDVSDKDIVGKLSELSIENILTHDKIIAFIDQNTISLSSLLKSHVNSSDVPPLIKDPVKDGTVSSNLKHTELVLSPPLQELSLDKIVKAQSDSVLCELDISPLNSIQETDSDSDVSSEGTMIMMTTEESEKNEQHIRESFLKYETKKKEKVQTQEPSTSLEPNPKIKNESVSVTPCRTLKIVDFDDISSVFGAEKASYSLEESICLDSSLCVEPSTTPEKSERDLSEFNILPPPEKASRTSSLASSSSMVWDENSRELCVQEVQRKSYKTSKHPYYLDDKSLASVQIPKDVRVWKVSSPEKNAKANYVDVNSDSLTSNDKCLPRRLNFDPELCDMTETSQSVKTDELESFVNASRERVQRIRKRYLDKTQRTSGSSKSPVRGVRPRFGSTAEILQLVQKKSQPPLTSFIPRSQVISWPCVDSFSNSEFHKHSRQQLIHMLGCQTLPGEYSLPSSYSSYVSEDSSSSTCDYDSVSSCPSIFFHERGVPEGASPPRSLSEDSIEQCSNEDSSVVYFSMKV